MLPFTACLWASFQGSTGKKLIVADLSGTETTGQNRLRLGIRELWHPLLIFLLLYWGWGRTCRPGNMTHFSGKKKNIIWPFSELVFSQYGLTHPVTCYLCPSLMWSLRSAAVQSGLGDPPSPQKTGSPHREVLMGLKGTWVAPHSGLPAVRWAHSQEGCCRHSEIHQE